MPEPEHRELPPEFAAELDRTKDQEPVELDLQALAKIKAEIASRDPLVRMLKGDA